MKLYQYAICPFCNKTKAALKFLKVPFSPIEVNPITKREIKDICNNDYVKVPLAIGSQNTVIGGSLEIIEKGIEISPKKNDKEFISHFLSDSARKWHTWSDEKFIIYLFPNITRSMSESFQTLKYVHNVFPVYNAWPLRILGTLAFRMFAHPKIKKKYNIDNERSALWKATDKWEQHVVKSSGGFSGGERPDLSDFAIYGSVKGLDFLPIYEEFCNRPIFNAWMQRMIQYES